MFYCINLLSLEEVRRFFPYNNKEPILHSMKKFTTYLFLLITTASYSQQDLTLYFLENVPQRQYLNPAFRPLAKKSIGLPVVSSIYMDNMTTTFTPDNLFDISNGAITFSTDKLKQNIRDNNYFGVTSKIDIFSIGVQKNKSYFSFNISENMFSRINLSRGILELPLYKDADFAVHGGKFDMSNTGMNFSHYREFGFGWQRQMSDKLNIGVRVKLLAGKSNVWIEKNTFRIQTNQTNDNWQVDGELGVKTSGFDSSGNIRSGNVGSYMLNSQNKGFALDAGITYKIGKKIELSASMVDFGFINWSSENNNIQTNNVSFSFRGIDISEIVYTPDSLNFDTLSNAYNRLQNAASNQLGYSENKNSYRKSLMARFHFGGTYTLFKKGKLEGKAGVLVQAEIYNNLLRPSLTLSYNQNVGRWLNASVSYSMINSNRNNLGLGISANLGPIQVYAALDNVFAAKMTTFTTTNNGQREDLFSYPTNSYKTHAHVGINLTFGAKKAAKERESIIEE